MSRRFLYTAFALSLALLTGEEIARGAGGAGNVLSSVDSNTLLSVDSSTLASSVSVGTIATFIGGGTGLGNIIVGSGVNQIALTGAATGTRPSIVTGGTSADTNIGLILAGKGTGSVLLGGTTTTLAGLQIAQPASRVNDILVTPGATGTIPIVASGGAGSDSNIGLELVGSGTGRVYVGGTAITAGGQFTQTASAVNDFVFTNTATGSAPSITVGGSSVDTNVGAFIAGAGTGAVGIGGTSTTLAGLQVAQTASRVNDVLLTPGATGSVPILASGGAGADANIGFEVAASGTGTLLLGGTGTTAGVQIPQTASAINDLVVTPGAIGVAPTVVVGGTAPDTNAGISIAGRGTGPVLLGGTTTTLAGVQIAQTASRVNDLLVTPGATGTSVILDANSAGADTNAGITMSVKGTGKVTLGSTTTCSGTTTATCATSQRFVASVTGLTTAAGGASATAMTVTDTTVLSSSTLVLCSVNGYSGTGQPIVTNITPGTGTVSFQITNVAASGSLNATVPVACVVF